MKREEQSEPLLRLTGITRAFPGVRALSGVDFAVDGGEVVSLVGQNGAGKSTLMNIVGGIHSPQEGRIAIAGKEVQIASPAAAEELGIGFVHQEPTLVENLTVAGNIFLNQERVKAGIVLDFKKMKVESRRITSTLGLEIDPDRLVRDLSLVEKEVVEIAKAMLLEPRILILDEVTAPLDRNAVERLFEIVAALKAEGIAIIFISHRLDEVIRVSDRIVVLRDGKNAGELSPSQTAVSERDIISLMLGRKPSESLVGSAQAGAGEGDSVPDGLDHPETPGRGAGLSVRKLAKSPHFEDVSFDLFRGEILGFAGLKGSGVTELFKTAFGALRRNRGEVLIGDREVALRRPSDAIRNGIGMLTNDRQGEGLALPRQLEENVTVSSLDRLANRLGFFRPSVLSQRAAVLAENLSVRAHSLNQQVLNLSGGNQQKIVLAKWLLRDLDVVIADEPTRGVDVHAKEEIYKLLMGLKQDGKAIMVHSPETLELLAICDRIIVIDSGRVVGEVGRGSPRFNEGDILEMMHATLGKQGTTNDA